MVGGFEVNVEKSGVMYLYEKEGGEENSREVLCW